MNSRNLHICPDDKFFHSFMANQQHFVPDTENNYFIVSNSDKPQQDSKNANVIFLNKKQIINRLKENADTYNQVIFHSLPTLFRKNFLPVIPNSVTVTWIFYGYEYYHRREVIRDYLGPVTKDYYNSIRNPNYIPLILNRLKDGIRQEPKQYSRDLRRVDRFAHWNIGEYEMIKDQYGLSTLKYVPFSMGVPIPELNPDMTKHYLLFGHSGAISNNHYDGINQLDRSITNSFDRIVLPFSYGAHSRYRKWIVRKARQKFGHKLLIISKFMERSSYFNVLSRVKLAWMPQLRASGGGNIRFCLTNDIPVVLDEESVLYKYYKKHGAQVYSIQSSGTQIPALTREHRLQNKQFLLQYRSPDTLKSQYRRLLCGNDRTDTLSKQT